MKKEGKLLTNTEVDFHKAYSDSFVTHVILKVLEKDFIIENIQNKIFGWYPICENIIDLDNPSKKICYKNVIKKY